MKNALQISTYPLVLLIVGYGKIMKNALQISTDPLVLLIVGYGKIMKNALQISTDPQVLQQIPLVRSVGQGKFSCPILHVFI